MIEITGYSLKNGELRLYGRDVSEEHLMFLERRGDDDQNEIEFFFNTKEKKDYSYIVKWLHSQKAAKSAETYREALMAIIGTMTTINSRYRQWD